MRNDIFVKQFEKCEVTVEFGVDAETENELYISIDKQILNDYEPFGSIGALRANCSTTYKEIWDDFVKAFIYCASELGKTMFDFEQFQFNIEFDRTGNTVYRLFAKRKNNIEEHEREKLKETLIEKGYVWMNANQ